MSGYLRHLEIDLKDEIFNWRSSPYNAMEDFEFSQLVWDVLTVIHEFDKYMSGDSLQEQYTNAKETFKKKWLNSEGHNETIKELVDISINDLRRGLYQIYNLKEIEETDVGGILDETFDARQPF